jgi:glycosyltransferase involved in cell wall biosynthesis
MKIPPIKVLMIAHCSHSYFATDKSNKEEIKKITLNDWYFKTAVQLKKFYPEIEVECLSVEKSIDNEESFVEEGIKLTFFPVKFSPMYALDYSPELIKAIGDRIKEDNDRGIRTIIHIHEIHNLHGLIIAKKFKDIPIIVQHHGGSWPIRHLKINKKYRLFFPIFLFAQLAENKILKNVKCFYALDKGELDYIKKTVPKAIVRFQTMGIGEEYFKKIDKKEARKKLGIKKDQKLVIFLGRVNETKGVRYLIDAWENVDKNVDLKIIGFGEVDNFKKYAADKGLKNVELTGPIFGDKKLLYLSAADCLVLPSTKEGAPVVVMESLAKNLPVVVTDVGGVRMMIENGREGIIINQRSSEEIAKAINEILKWKNKDVKKYAEKYKWKTIINDTVKDYLNVVNKQI